MDTVIKLGAEEFVRALHSSPEIKNFQSARERYESDPEISKLRAELASLTRQLQEKQYNSNITQEELNQYKEMQRRLSHHPLFQQYAQAQQQVVALLQACNEEMSQVLGFDFAATAAPAASC